MVHDLFVITAKVIFVTGYGFGTHNLEIMVELKIVKIHDEIHIAK